MQPDIDTPEHHRRRSEFIRNLVQGTCDQQVVTSRYFSSVPKTIVQYWHDLRQLPNDVRDCIASWTKWDASGYRHCLFDEHSAKAFIADSLGVRYQRAFERCYHPAMQADYFRLCYLLVKGGMYVDADDVCLSSDISGLFDDSRLKVQPLCYDIESGTMVSASKFLRASASENWIFYFNNNPLIAGQDHPIIDKALSRATNLLETAREGALLEIQSTTGPGNLTRTIFEFGARLGDVEREISILREWDTFAVSKWPLSYRNDSRNWRLSNQQYFYIADA